MLVLLSDFSLVYFSLLICGLGAGYALFVLRFVVEDFLSAVALFEYCPYPVPVLVLYFYFSYRCVSKSLFVPGWPELFKCNGIGSYLDGIPAAIASFNYSCCGAIDRVCTNELSCQL